MYFQKIFNTTICLLFFVLTVGIQADDSVRCDGRLLELNDPRIKVLKYCGEPSDRVDYKRHTFIHNRYINLKTKNIRSKLLVDRFVIEFNDTEDYYQELTLFNHKHHTHQHITSHFDNTKKLVIETKSVIRKHNIFNDSLFNDLDHENSTWKCLKMSDEYNDWIYNLGPGKFIRIITFRNGKIWNIESGDYGF